MKQQQPGTSSLSGEDAERLAFREAVRTAAPTWPGIFAWGMVVGLAMTKSGLTVWQALGMTLLVYAGSAQLAVLPLIAAGAQLWLIFFTALVVNLRFLIFSAVFAPHFMHLERKRKLLYGYLCADLAMAFFPRRFPESAGPATGKAGYFTGIVYPNWMAWQSGSVVGIVLATRIPDSWGMAFAGSLAMLGVLIPLIVNSAALTGVVVASLAAVLGADLPYRLGLVLATVLGMVAAMLADRLSLRLGRGGRV